MIIKNKYLIFTLIILVIIVSTVACDKKNEILFGSNYDVNKNSFKIIYKTLPSDETVSVKFASVKPFKTKYLELKIYRGKEKSNKTLFGGSGIVVNEKDKTAIVELPLLETGSYYIEINSDDEVLAGKSIEVYGKGEIEDKK